MKGGDWVNLDNSALLTDLYELTMLQAYHQEGLRDRAVFDLFFRKLPDNRNFLVAAGVETALDYLEHLHFSEEALEYLASLDQFSSSFIDYLADFRFTGEVRAVPEGSLVFPNEPLLEVIAPIPEAQLAETFLLNQIHFQTLMASKASRVVDAARGKTVVDFGARRMHGADATLKAARAFYIAGVHGTSNVLAGQAYGIPVSGTMAHSYIEAHPDEESAFEAFASLYPDTILLVDTYDTLEGVQKVAEMARRLGDRFKVGGIRLDSGDLGELARSSRGILDEHALQRVGIFASGSLDEYAIAELLDEGAPIDGFGVGTHLGVSEDSPYLDSAYKLVEYAGTPRMKLATQKATLPYRKQVFRHKDAEGYYAGDTIAGLDEPNRGGEPLLETVMQEGKRTGSPEGLERIRERAAQERSNLPAALRGIQASSSPYPITVSQDLQNAVQRLRASLEG